MRLGPIFNVLRRQKLFHRLPEDVRIVAVVETKLELVQVRR